MQVLRAVQISIWRLECVHCSTVLMEYIRMCAGATTEHVCGVCSAACWVSCVYVDIMSVAMAAVDVSKTTLSLMCILFRAYCHVQRFPFSSYTSPFTSHLCIFEFQAYLSLPQSTYLAIGLHLIWFMYCIQCTATLLLFGVQSMCIRAYLFFLYIHTYVSIYILYLYCTLHCIKILSPEFEWLCIVKLNLYVISLNPLLFTYLVITVCLLRLLVLI